jgi:hypothetical protein
MSLQESEAEREILVWRDRYRGEFHLGIGNRR